MKGRHEILMQSLTPVKAAAMRLSFNVPLVSERFCQIYDELAAQDKKFIEPSLIVRAAKILETFENEWARPGITEDKTLIVKEKKDIVPEIEAVSIALLLAQIKKEFLSQYSDGFLSLVSSLTHYDEQLFIAFKVFLKQLIENDDIKSICKFHTVLLQLDEERSVDDEDDVTDLNFFSDLFSDLLIQIDKKSNSSLLGLILKKYKSIVSNPMPLVDKNSYTQFTRGMLHATFINLNQEEIIHILIDVCINSEKVKSNLTNTLLGEVIYFWEISSGVMTDTLITSINSQYSPSTNKKKIQENFTKLRKIPVSNYLFAENFHYLYLLVTNSRYAHPEFEKIRAELHLILDVLREGGSQFSLFTEALLDEDCDFSKQSINAIKRLVQANSSVSAISPYQEKIDLLRRHQSLLLEYFKKFNLALEGDAPEVKTAYSVLVKPWLSLSKLVEQRERTLIELGRYFKKVRFEKQVSFDVKELEIQSIPVPDWGFLHLDACRGEIEELINLLQSIGSDPTYVANQLVRDIPAIIKVISSINISVASCTNFAGAGSSTSESDAFTLTPIASPYTLDGSTVKTSRFSAESPTFTFVSPILRCLTEAQQKLEVVMLTLNPLLASLLSMAEVDSPSVKLSCLTQDAQDLWQLMQQVSQWSARISTDPLGVNLFDDAPLMMLPIQRISAEIISPFYSFMTEDLSLIIEKWNREINNLALSLKVIFQQDLSFSFNPNIDAFIKKLSACYFYPRNKPIYKYLQDVFGILGTVEVFGAQLFMQDNCDTDVRIILKEKGGTQESVALAVLTELARKDPHGNYRLKIQQYHLIHDSGVYPVISIKLLAGPNNCESIDLSIFPNGFFESNHYVPHAAASLNLKNGRLHCGHDFFKNILDNQFIIREEASLYTSILSREIHILKFLIRARFVPAAYLGRLSLLNFGPEADYIYQTLKEYGVNLLGLKQINPLLEEALRTLIKRHFKEDLFTPAFLNRTANFIRFCKSIGCKLIANRSHQQFELELGPEPLQLIQLKLIKQGVKDDYNRSLFFELNAKLEACLRPLPYVQHALLGLFRARSRAPFEALDNTAVSTEFTEGIFRG